MNTTKEVAVGLKITVLSDFGAIPQNNPIQFDGFSCGVFVCWMIMRPIAALPPHDMSASPIRDRLELFCYLLTGRLLPVEAAASAWTEEKRPVQQTEYPTQAANK